MLRRGLLAAAAGGVVGVPLAPAVFSPRPARAQPQGVAFEEFMVPGGDPGIELYLRNKRPEAAPAGGASAARTVICVHGATYPASTGFDLPLGGISWLDYMASAGFDAWTVDLRNYGRSTREAAMSRPPEGAAPLTTAEQAVADLAAAARFVRERRGVPRTVVIGWSWGTATAGRFAAANPSLVERLVLYAPVWAGDGREGFAAGLPPVTSAYRTVTRAAARERWLGSAPENRRATLLPPGHFEHWADVNFASDPEGARQTPSVLRAPNGVLVDFQTVWNANRAGYDPAAIAAPTMLVVAEWDRDTPPSRAYTLFPLLANSPGKRLVVLGEGTHSIMLERNRGALFQSVQVFLQEGAAA